MRKLSEFYRVPLRIILIDSPPVRLVFTDGVLIASMVDGVLLVVSRRKELRGVGVRGNCCWTWAQSYLGVLTPR